ncbi:MAG: hypothetical protein CMB25_08190 [Euryarchaeota archaeon]|nr:hypothetical protein [Euryarchaeota archaeon]
MALVPLDLKSGFYRNGTELEASNRWREGSLVRWIDGSLKPVGGWAIRKSDFCNNAVRGMHAWQSNNGTAWVAGGSHDQLVAMTGAGTAYDLTPDDLTAGRSDASVNTGYGFGFYGTDFYGQPRQVTSSSIPQEATTWKLDNFGQNLIGLHQDDGRIWQWDLTTTIGSELVTNGNFATDTNWTKGTNWSISGGVAVYAQYQPIINANSNSVISYATNKITITSHNFSNGDEIKYVVPSGQTAINGLTTGTNYFVVNATTNDFQLSATSGGSAITLLSRNALMFDADNDAIKNTTTNKIVASNTFSNGDEVEYNNGGGTDIGALVNNQNYFIINASGSEFQLAATSGGSAIDLTPDLNASFDPDPITTSATSITVTVANVGGVNKYHFGGVTAPTLTLIRGTTYTFDMSDATNANHPLVFTNNGAFYLTGVTTTGTAGQAGASVTFAVDANAPATGLAYACSIHGGGMGNTITTVTAAAAAGPIDYSTETITISSHGFSNGDEVKYSNNGGANIGGLTTGTNYFVVSASTNTLKLAATSGGTAINLTAPSGTLGTGHSFDLDIGSSHIFVQQIGTTHQLQRQNFGNLDQDASSLVTLPDIQDSYDVTVTLVDPNTDSNAATVPDVKIKVTGTTTSTVSVHETLAVGANIFRFGADDTTVKIEIIPQAYNTPDFNIDTISLKKKTVVEPITNAPLNNKAIVVTEERFIFALGAGGNSRKVAWCDKENNTVWTPAVTNEAGDQELATAGQIMCGVRTRGGTLIITDTDAHIAQYQGPPYVYGFQRVATECGAVARLAAVTTDIGAFWFGQENFHYFDGNSVQTLNCDVHDYVFADFNSTQQSKIWGMVNGANSEVWWFYCSSNATEPDRYVAYDFVDNHWLIGNLARSSGVGRGVFRYPMMAEHTTKANIYNHEVGFNYDTDPIFCETGAIVVGNGDEILKVTSVIPDEKTQGDVDLTFKAKLLPNDTERTYGPFNPANPTAVRFSGRQIKMRVDGDRNVDWRGGVMRLDVKSGGTR